MTRAQEYALRREALQVQCAEQREQLAEASTVIESHLDLVDRKVTEFRQLRLPLLWVAGGAALAAALGFRRIGSVVQLISRISAVVSLVRRFL